jgi:four helix bundle protein
MPNEIAEQLRERTMRFALRVMRFCRTLTTDWEGRFVADQLFRASARTSANYHAACRARSRREFISKLGMEARELLAIFIQSAKTASHNQ